MWINKGKKVPLMSFQGGGYIPGLSAARFRGGLGRDIRKTQEDIQSQAEGLGKEQKQSGLWGKVGGVIGEYGLPALAQSLNLVAPGAGIVAGAALKGVGKGVGQYAGEKLAGLDDPAIKASSTGLLGGQFDLLQETQDKFKQGALGRSVKSGAGTALTSGLGDYAQAHMGSEIGKGLKGVGIDIGKAGPGQVMSQAGTPVGIPTADTGLATDYFKETLGFQEGGYAKEYQEGGKVDPLLPMSSGLVANLLSRFVLDKGELIPNYGEFNRLLINEPEPGDRLTPEEEILLELLNQSNQGKDKKREKMDSNVVMSDVDPQKKSIRSPFRKYQEGGNVPMFNPMSSHGAIDSLMVENSLANSYEQMPETTSYTSRGPMRIELDPSVDYEMRRPAPVQDAKLSDRDLMDLLHMYSASGSGEFDRIFGGQGNRLGQVDFNTPESNIPKLLPKPWTKYRYRQNRESER